MGKFMRKAKITGEVAIMEVVSSSRSTLGVCTRSRTLALQRGLTSDVPTASSSSYLQLRNRRLDKPPLVDFCANGVVGRENEATLGGRGGGGGNSGKSCAKRRGRVVVVEEEAEDDVEEAEVASWDPTVEHEGEGESDLRERILRESTPACSLVLDSDPLEVPGSTTQTTYSNSSSITRILKSAVRRSVPTTHEMEEFFAGAERQQQMKFTEKYNFDPVNDCPLPGRYEWRVIMLKVTVTAEIEDTLHRRCKVGKGTMRI